MSAFEDEIRWPPRVARAKLKRAYESTVGDLWDEELIDDVGITLLLRCRAILKIHRAQTEKIIACPRCDRAGKSSLIARKTNRNVPMICPACGWSMTWLQYHGTFKGRQLNPGGAVAYFERFVLRYEQARTAREKMLAIDQVIHEFHYSLRELPDQPTRAAGVNLIEGKLTDVVRFLDELSGLKLSAEIQEAHEVWRRKQATIRWEEILERKARGAMG